MAIRVDKRAKRCEFGIFGPNRYAIAHGYRGGPEVKWRERGIFGPHRYAIAHDFKVGLRIWVFYGLNTGWYMPERLEINQVDKQAKRRKWGVFETNRRAIAHGFGHCPGFGRAIVQKLSEAFQGAIAAFSQSGFPQEALSLFRDMQNEYSQPNNVTLVSVIPACAELRAVRLGKSAHCHAIKASMDSDVSTGTALVSMYAKCNLFNSALNLFNKMPLIEVVTWNALINRYAQIGDCYNAGSRNNGWCASRLCLLGRYQRGHNSERPTCRVIFDVLERGHDYTIHAYIIKSGFQSHKLVANSLIDMYAKCGQLDLSESVFEEMENTDSVSWNALLTAYSMHGEGDCALSVFSLMEKRDVEVDSISFLSVLSAGRHAGLVEEGRKIFHCMRDKYHIEPEAERYACLVDLLGRAGLFSEIMDLLKTMPMEPDAGVWGALLDASR
ncbi:hypothetical protein CQW23_32748 [Capsicum baccatum]|uniref:Pentatricopeptide repeat-containing protein n=1 Tax=Capsicum baccatum TaxID=33114 RepID=A0A2G2V3V7_CAPBA|nr:hypothetical protein CQW23_32748 [Capsicum baccatum]